MGNDTTYGGKAKSKRCVFRYFLKVATGMAEWTDSGRLFQRDGAQEWKALAPVLVLTLGIDKLLSLIDGLVLPLILTVSPSCCLLYDAAGLQKCQNTRDFPCGCSSGHDVIPRSTVTRTGFHYQSNFYSVNIPGVARLNGAVIHHHHYVASVVNRSAVIHTSSKTQSW